MHKALLNAGVSALALSAAVWMIGGPAAAQSAAAAAAGAQSDAAPIAQRPAQAPPSAPDAAAQPLGSASPHVADAPGASGDVPANEVVITGTSIRGVAPVGSNLVSVGTADIKATGAVNLEQALANVPALTGMGSVGQGQTNNSYYQPTIHSLGASASNSTLILIDGHRLPTGGTNHSTADPNILPLNMVQRVEVLPDGASSVYGSDAVAGVINFITRKSFDGIQLTGQGVFENGASGYSAGVLAGRHWDHGSTIIAYTYSNLGELNDSQRAYTNPNHIGQGGTNFGNFNCSPATLQPGGAGSIFLNATSGQSLANTAANSPCSQWADTALVQQEVRNNFLVKATQDFGDSLTVTGELVAASRRDQGITPAGTITATAYGTGAQANPFYMTPAGYTGTATNQTVRWDADQLLGPGRAYNGSDDIYGHIDAEYRIGDNFVIDFLALVGRDDSFTKTTGTVNGSVANLELNGTTNSAGNLTQPSVPGTSTAVLALPLTTANALDVWDPAGSNRTSAAALAELTDNANLTRLVSGIRQFRLSTNGTVFTLPGGPVRIAVGAEYLGTSLDEYVERANNAGPASLESQQLNFNFNRQVYSTYGELDVPVVGPEMNVPFVRGIMINLSGRYDHYSDFGSTVNPKYAMNWDVVEGFKIRGNWSTSFVAPPLDILGNQYGAFATATSASTTNSVQVPVAIYPQVAQLGIPGCTASSVTCNISSLQGIQVTSGNHDAQAQKGTGWSIGADYTPQFLRTLHTQITYWNTNFTGGITGPNLATAVNASGEYNLLSFYPGCASSAQIAAASAGIPQTSVYPNCTSYIFHSLNSNYLNLYISGIDASFDYAYHTQNFGTARLGGSLTQFLKFDQNFTGGPTFSVLNTSGYNTSFPSVSTQARMDFGWTYDNVVADVFVNYTGGYRNYSGNSVNLITKDAYGNPTGGGDWVDANTTIDLHLAYDFPADIAQGWLKGDEVALSVRNLFDKEPPFYNSTSGYDTYVANPLGRVISLAFTAKFF